VFMANHGVSNRPAASIRVNEEQASEVFTPGLGTSRAIADRTDIHARRRLGMVSVHGFSTTAFSFALIHSSMSALRDVGNLVFLFVRNLCFLPAELRTMSITVFDQIQCISWS
jgi:hypothetical protein